ncbi:MAG: hypothetical protein AAF899_13300 [Pseudomonadota bacterium]
MEGVDLDGVVDAVTARLTQVMAEIGADGTIALEIAVAVILVLAVVVGWLLHTLWTALGPRNADLIARAHAAEAECQGWRAEALRLSRLLEARDPDGVSPSAATDSGVDGDDPQPMPGVGPDTPETPVPSRYQTVIETHDKA